MKFIKEHLGFILTILITYILGICLIIVQYVSSNNNNNFMELLLNSFIPTTITYVLGCVLVNISEFIKQRTKYYVYNIFTCFSVFIYAMIYCIYIITGYSFVWTFIEIVFTCSIIYLNIKCYQEKYKNRNHKLT